MKARKVSNIGTTARHETHEIKFNRALIIMRDLLYYILSYISLDITSYTTLIVMATDIFQNISFLKVSILQITVVHLYNFLDNCGGL